MTSEIHVYHGCKEQKEWEKFCYLLPENKTSWGGKGAWVVKTSCASQLVSVDNRQSLHIPSYILILKHNQYFVDRECLVKWRREKETQL